MIEVKFTGDSMAALRAQIADFIGDGVALTSIAHPHSAPATGKKKLIVEPASSASGAGTATEAGTAGTGETTSAAKDGDAPLTEGTGAASGAASTGPGTSTAGSAGSKTAAEITYEDIRTMVLKLSVAKGRDAVFEFLGQFGAKKTAQEIDPSKYGEAMVALKALVEG